LLAAGCAPRSAATPSLGGHRAQPAAARSSTGRSTTESSTRSSAARPGGAQAGAAKPPTNAEWRKLARSLEGTIVRPGQSGYATDVQLYDFRYDSVRPAGVAYCATAQDVARCIAFAREYGIVPTPRAGGHSYAGYSTSPGLVVDVTRMASIQAPTESSTTATIGAGARLIDVYTALNAKGVSVPAGSCPTVGISGLTLGGGIGVVCRRHGLTSDSVVSARVVTADSQVVTASAETNADLYWACRGGGGGNFGVVTSWEMATFRVPDEVSLFTLTWPWAAAGQVLAAWQAWLGEMPDELWSNCVLYAQPGSSQPRVQVAGVYLGSTGAANGLIARLISAAGHQSTYFLEQTAFSHAMYVEANCAQLSRAACHLPTQTPSGVLTRAPSIAKSELLTSPLVEVGINALVAAIDAGQDHALPGAVAFDALGGAMSTPAADATAWVHRDATFGIQYSVPLAMGDSPGVIAGYRTWLDGVYRSIRPHVSGQSYQNYIDPDLPNWKQAYYGANLARLEAVRKKWDPDAAFRFAQVIPRAR
jgi:hypothetical protein